MAWCSKKSNRVLTSSTEAECAAVIEAAKENAWVSKFVEELSVFRREQEATVIFQDNKGVLSLSKGGSHKRSKHFDIEFFAVAECVKKREIEMHYIPTQNMLADMFTKNLPHSQYEKLQRRVMKGEIDNVNVGGRGIDDTKQTPKTGCEGSGENQYMEKEGPQLQRKASF